MGKKKGGQAVWADLQLGDTLEEGKDAQAMYSWVARASLVTPCLSTWIEAILNGKNTKNLLSS